MTTPAQPVAVVSSDVQAETRRTYYAEQ